MNTSSLRPKVLIVEDQLIIAMMIEDAVIAAGLEVAGLASCAADAHHLASQAEIALVDVNLTDGPTGPQIGATLAAEGKAVIFMTGNPKEVSSGVPGTLGVIAKPVSDDDLVQVISFAAAHYAGSQHPTPRNLILFNRT